MDPAVEEILINEVFKQCFKLLGDEASKDEYKVCLNNYIRTYDFMRTSFE